MPPISLHALSNVFNKQFFFGVDPIGCLTMNALLNNKAHILYVRVLSRKTTRSTNKNKKNVVVYAYSWLFSRADVSKNT